MAVVAVQINGQPPCPIWTEVAKNHETVWLDCSPHQPPTPNPVDFQPDLVVVQCAVRWWDLRALGWDQLKCPIIASCGDASVLCNLPAVFHNLTLLTRLYVEGQDYIDKYDGVESHKFRFFKTCADNHFPPLDGRKVYDWCFLGQTYDPWDCRLKHFRRELVPQLLGTAPNGYVSGPGWASLIGDKCRGDWVDQSQVNAVYASSRAVVSIDAHDGVGYTSTRTIEAMHAGHCVLVYDHPGMAYLKQWVRDGEHVLFFSTVAEFQERLAAVVADPALAANLGRNARRLVLERGWTASAWMRECLSLLGD